MTSGPIVVQVLEGEDAIQKNRDLMGATNPANADEGTIRKDFAENVEANSVHGSDAPETATEEISYFLANWNWLANPDFCGRTLNPCEKGALRIGFRKRHLRLEV